MSNEQIEKLERIQKIIKDQEFKDVIGSKITKLKQKDKICKDGN